MASVFAPSRRRGSATDGLVVLAFAFGLPAIDREPAGIDDDLAVGLELLPLDGGDARRDLELRRRIKHRDEAARDEIVDFLLRLAQALRHGAGGDDGKVIADFGVIEDALVRLDAAVRAAPSRRARTSERSSKLPMTRFAVAT